MKMDTLNVYWHPHYKCGYWIDPRTNEAVYVRRVSKLVFVKHFLKKGYCKRVIFHYGRKKEYTQKDIY